MSFVFRSDCDKVVELIKSGKILDHLDELQEVHEHFSTPVYEHIEQMYDILNEDQKQLMISELDKADSIMHRQYLIALLDYAEMEEYKSEKILELINKAKEEKNFSLPGVYLQDSNYIDSAIDCYLKDQNYPLALEAAATIEDKKKMESILAVTYKHALDSENAMLALFASQYDYEGKYQNTRDKIIEEDLEFIINIDVLDQIISLNCSQTLKVDAIQRKIGLLVETKQIDQSQIDGIEKLIDLLIDGYEQTNDNSFLNAIIKNYIQIQDYSSAKSWATNEGSAYSFESLSLYEKLAKKKDYLYKDLADYQL